MGLLRPSSIKGDRPRLFHNLALPSRLVTERHMDVNSFPRVTTRQCDGRESNGRYDALSLTTTAQLTINLTDKKIRSVGQSYVAMPHYRRTVLSKTNTNTYTRRRLRSLYIQFFNHIIIVSGFRYL